MSKPVELEPCPFCGGEAFMIHGYDYRVECDNCGCRTQEYVSQEDAAEAWNNRRAEARQ